MIEDVDSEARTEPRTNLFVMATISASTESMPVKVRNLSAGGALIEGAVLPAAKEKVHLRRGPLAVGGEIVWRRSGQAGLRFQTRVKVEEWLPTKDNRVAQQRVDEIVQQLRAETGSSPLSSIREAAPADLTSGAELAKLAAAIEALAGDLAEDSAVVSRHFSRLQMLDIAAQVLWKLSAERP